MRMTGEERIAVARARVWQALNDVEVLRQCIPGCQSMQTDGVNRWRAIVEIKIGPIGARFNSVLALSEIDAPNSYTISGEGQGGTVGSAKSVIKVKLVEDGTTTLLSYEVDAQVGGRLAQLGGPIIDATAKQLANKFFARFAEIVTTPATDKKSRADAATVSSASAPVPKSSPATTLPIAWILALVVAALAGFLVGRGQNGADSSDWMGLAVGLMIFITAAAAFEFGRRTAAPQIVVDAALLQRLLREEKQ